MTTRPAHPTPALILRYTTGEGGIDDATIWAIEAHLESCAPCRAQLADAAGPDTTRLLDRVADQLAAAVAAEPPPERHRRLWRTGLTARVLPWLAAAAGLMLTAVLFDQTADHLPSLVLLTAPIAPLLPVAAVWSRRTDPGWELTTTAARAGLWLLLRRTTEVLAVVIPVLAVAAWPTGHSPAAWLLPCLAFTAGTLALGGWLGVDRAALGLMVAWATAVIAPSLLSRQLPTILAADSWPGWALLTTGFTAVVVLRAAHYRRVGVGRM